MSATNRGNQYLTFDYKHPSKAGDFNTLLREGISSGVYEGLTLNKIDNTTISIDPGVMYLNVGDDKTLRAEVRDSFEFTVSPENPVVYATYSWLEAIENWIDWSSRGEADPSVTNEVVLGRAVYSGITMLGVDYDLKDWGQRIDLLTNYNEDSGPLSNSNELFLLDSLKKTTLQTLKAFFDGNIGDVKHVHEDFPNAPAQPAWWAAMDGSVIDDEDSPFDGYRLPNDNGADVVLTVTWASGVATISDTDITALAVGDRVAGSGIDSGAVITDITVNDVTISDTDFSGADVETTFNNPGRFWRAAGESGPGDNDAMQRITGSLRNSGSGYRVGNVLISGDDGSAGVFSAGTNTTNIFDVTTTTTTNDTFFRSANFNSADSDYPNPAKTDDEETRPIYRQYVGYMKIKNTP